MLSAFRVAVPFNSSFGDIIATGGGGGGGFNLIGGKIGGSGGGGGGSSHASYSTTGAGGTANQGNAGGNGATSTTTSGAGGGGGSGTIGTNGAGGNAGNAGRGGHGLQYDISGTATYYAGGGGGGKRGAGSTGLGGFGGGGSGGHGVAAGTNGTANTGGGGGGAADNTVGGSGGSGIVIVRYPILQVTALTPTPVGAVTATLHGRLDGDLGDTDTTVAFCLGYEDAGTEHGTSAWLRVESMGPGWSAGQSFSTNLTGLISGSNYVYRCYITNSQGEAWSPEAVHFATFLNGWYVATNGNNVSGTSWATAFTNLQAALNIAAEGDTVYVAGQTFVLPATVLWSNNVGITVLGSYAADGGTPGHYDFDAHPTVLRPAAGNTNRLLNMRVPNSTLERFEFRDAGTATGAAIYFQNAAGLAVNDARFFNNTGLVGHLGTLYANNATGTVTRAVFANNTMGRGSVAYTTTSGRIILYDIVAIGNASINATSDGTLYNAGRIFVNNGLFVANKTAGGNSAVLWCDSTGGINAYNVTIAYNYSSATRSSRIDVYDSIVYGNWPLQYISDSDTFTNSCVGDGRAPDTRKNFSDDPRFEWPLFYLATNSPCLFKGSRTATAAGLGAYTVFTNGTTYANPGTDKVHVGYHHPAGLTIPPEVFVNPQTGADTNPGTAGAPLKSITKALTLATNKTIRINLAAGNYTTATETFPLRVAEKTAQLVGAGAGSTVIDATGAGTSARALEFTSSAGDNRIEGLTVRCASNTLSGAGVYVGGAILTIADSVIASNWVNEVNRYGGGIASEGSIGKIVNTTLADNVARTTNNNHGGGGMAIASAGRWELDRVQFIGNRAIRSSGSSTVTGGGLLVNATGGSNGVIVQIRNSLFRGNEAAAQGNAMTVAAGGAATVENCTFVENTGAATEALRSGTGLTTVENSVFHGNNGNDIVIGGQSYVSYSLSTNLTLEAQGNITNAPVFKNAGAGDYSLKSGSPGIDVGITRDWMAGTKDLAGGNRVLGLAVDMGAYETVLTASGSVFIFR